MNDMFKMGGFYVTTKGRLVKLFNQFAFQDGYVISAAVYAPGSGWFAVRYNINGVCNVDSSYNGISTNETYEHIGKYMKYHIWYDFNTHSWFANASDLHANIIVNLTGIENRERAMHLIYLGTEQKLLTWMREAGYDEDIEVKEVVNVDIINRRTQ